MQSIKCSASIAFLFASLLALLLALFIGVANAAEPSFECQERQAIAEHLVCGSEQLADLDKQLSELFREAMRATTLDREKNEAIREAHKSWLIERNRCEYGFDCLSASYQSRLLALREFMPGESFSWGGKLRDAPDIKSNRLGATKERQPITIIEMSDKIFNGYPWFKIEVDGQTGYQWGGILCDTRDPKNTACSAE